ncbi:hypothetical protein OF83DRAFT_1179270 [Amylostereum chailletii]|nr:hypothetical protein OF83DRAFT_1179270 [Amylostereum chailletii]
MLVIVVLIDIAVALVDITASPDHTLVTFNTDSLAVFVTRAPSPLTALSPSPSTPLSPLASMPTPSCHPVLSLAAVALNTTSSLLSTPAHGSVPTVPPPTVALIGCALVTLNADVQTCNVYIPVVLNTDADDCRAPFPSTFTSRFRALGTPLPPQHSRPQCFNTHTPKVCPHLFQRAHPRLPQWHALITPTATPIIPSAHSLVTTQRPHPRHPSTRTLSSLPMPMRVTPNANAHRS